METKVAPQDDVSVGKVSSLTEVPRGMPEILRNLSEEEYKALEKKLLRKIDFRLLPTMIIIYIMNYLDRCVYHNAQTQVCD